METYDVIVIGNGLAGAALSYELAKADQSVLLLDDGNPDSGTRYSYGGIGYWAGTTDLTTVLLTEGMARHRQLSEELGAPTQLRELDLLLTVAKDADLEALMREYAVFRTPPRFVSALEAKEIEPQINSEAIAGAFTISHGHVDPMSVVAAYNQAFRHLGGHHNLSAATSLMRIGDKITGVTTAAQAYPAKTVVIAAGAYSQPLIAATDLDVPLFFTHAEIVETPPLHFEVRSLVMPADNNRFKREAEAAQNPQWQTPNTQIMLPVLEAGVIQFQNKTARIGQISRFYTSYVPSSEPAESQEKMRGAIAQKIPAFASVSGTWRHCLVTFTQDGLPLLGALPHISGLHLFSGFTGPFALVPSVAQRYAQHLTGSADPLIQQMLVTRFQAAQANGASSR